MTCIVGLIKNGKVYIGGDSAGSDGWNVTVRKDTKVFKNSDFLIGYTSSFRMGQLLRFKFKPPKYHKEDKDLYEYMCTDFIDEVRSCLKTGGYAINDKGEEKGGFFLVGAHGRLFTIEDDYQVSESILPFEAVGCGDKYAKGSLISTKDWADPLERINTALTAASEFSAHVRPPFNILVSED